MLKNILPIGSAGSWIVAPKASFAPFLKRPVETGSFPAGAGRSMAGVYECGPAIANVPVPFN